MTDNVTVFPGADGLPENPMKIAPGRPGYCSHTSVVLDCHDRTVRCADPKCGAVLDAFDFLRGNAQTIDSAWRRYHEVLRQAGEVNDRVHALKKEEARLRAMVKRLQDKTGSVLVVRPEKGTL
jgi:hypothetical protein